MAGSTAGGNGDGHPGGEPVVKLIGLYACRPQCGKTTVAEVLAIRGYITVPFAGTIKRMLRLMLQDLGLNELEVEHALAGGKELPCPKLTSRTPRQLLQSLGTDWGRQMVDTTIWTRCWQQRVSSYLDLGVGVVVDDVRFAEEAQLVEALGGAMVEVVRPGGGSEAFTSHASEGGLNGWDFKARLINDGDLERLMRRADLLLEELHGQAHAQ